MLLHPLRAWAIFAASRNRAARGTRRAPACGHATGGTPFALKSPAFMRALSFLACR